MKTAQVYQVTLKLTGKDQKWSIPVGGEDDENTDETWYSSVLDRALRHNGGGAYRRISKVLDQSKPEYLRVTEERNVGRGTKTQVTTICKLRYKGKILSSGVAYQCPDDTDNAQIGNNIALSRAVRSLVAKRQGIIK